MVFSRTIADRSKESPKDFPISIATKPNGGWLISDTYNNFKRKFYVEPKNVGSKSQIQATSPTGIIKVAVKFGGHQSIFSRSNSGDFPDVNPESQITTGDDTGINWEKVPEKNQDNGVYLEPGVSGTPKPNCQTPWILCSREVLQYINPSHGSFLLNSIDYCKSSPAILQEQLEFLSGMADFLV